MIFVKLTGQNVNEVRGNVETTRAFAQPPPTITRPRAAGGRGMYPTCSENKRKPAAISLWSSLSLICFFVGGKVQR